MTERPFSSSWYRVASLTPRLRGHARIHRHVYRGQVWYVLHDEASSRLHRFTPSAHVIIGLMNGERTVEAIWETACTSLGDEAPTQDEVISLLGRLHQADVLQTDARPDYQETHRRHEKSSRGRITQRLKNPMAVRIPLLDPDRVLDGMQPLARALFNPVAFVMWIMLVMLGLAVAAANAEGLAAHAAEHVLTFSNLTLAALLFPLVKLFHEFGHGLAVKRWGGEVHETGIMLLVFLPVPYVDASGAAAFSDKYRRMAVSAAGIIVELAIAAVAVVLWASMEPGGMRDAAFNVVLICSVSTVLFNGNPLLRFDGYYVLSDLIEIPNLAQRSRSYLGYLVQRYAFRMDDVRSPVTAPGEAPRLLAYGVASAIYRVLVAVTIIMFVAGRFFIVGVVLAAIATVQMLVLPACRHMVFVLRSPVLARRRSWAVGLSMVVLGVLGAALVFAPVPLATRAEGVVWLPEDAKVRPGVAGFVRVAHASDGERVHKGQLLFELEDPARIAEMSVLEARVRELEVEHAVEAFGDRVKAEIVADQLATAREMLQRERDRTARLEVVSPTDGTLVVPGGAVLEGRYVRQGEELAVVVQGGAATVRAVVEQPDIALVRERPGPVQVQLADHVGQVLPARLAREVPAARYLLPSKVLGSEGGGQIPVEPGDSRGLKVTRKVFQVELQLADSVRAGAGQRVHVLFRHGTEPLLWQWTRRVQQVFLRRFAVGV